MEGEDRVVIVGAGPGGLAMAWRLERAGVPAVILERTHTVASSWKGHYESLQLFSERRISSLPGMRIPRSAGAYPRRDDLIAYFDAYAARVRTPIRFGVEVQTIERDGDAWAVRTGDGDLRARHVVVAAGNTAAPYVPPWPGVAGYAGPVITSDDYRNGEPYRGQHALVVGCGTTGTDIAMDLHEHGARRVEIAVRTPPQVFPYRILGIPTQYWNQPMKKEWFPDVVHDWITRTMHRVVRADLHPLGLPRVHLGHVEMYAGPRGHALNFDRNGIKLVKAGRIGLVAALERFEDDAVVLADGTRVRPDVVVSATGRKPMLGPLVGHLGLLGVHGRPLVHGGRTWPTAPGLFFLGYRMPPAQLPDMTPDTRAICRRIVAGRPATGGRPSRRRPAAPGRPRSRRSAPTGRTPPARRADRAPGRAGPARPAR